MMDVFTNQMLITLIFWMDSNSYIPKNRLWTTCSNRDEVTLPTVNRIPEIIHSALKREIFDLNIRKRRLKLRIPINEALIPVNKSLAVKFHKDMTDCSAQP